LDIGKTLPSYFTISFTPQIALNLDEIMPTPIASGHTLLIDKFEFVRTSKFPISPMMPGLLNSLNQKEVFDLMAYVLSGGDKNHESIR